VIFRRVINARQADPYTVGARCPACRHRVTLDSLGFHDALAETDYSSSQHVRFGHRRCPNGGCLAHLFVVVNETTRELIVSYPPEKIDFDASELPEAVVSAIEEAITCHSQDCYVASAIMVRKTLEEVCRDQGATGKNLRDRINDLGTKIVLPQPMLDALDNLRLLGNDAAHVESQEYDKVDKEEVEVAIDVTKEILKATYQYESLMGRLDALKKKNGDGAA
jgi:hypothetical protein